MGIDFKGAIKDNQKLLLSVAGVCALVMIIAVTSGSNGGLFDFWSLNGELGNGQPNLGSSPTPVSNGNNGKYISAPAFELDASADYQAVIQTNLGSITIDLFEKEAPNTVNNFVFLANEGFYNGTTFHRVIKDFVIQGGDPLGTGSGGPGYSFNDEITPGDSFARFSVAMANRGVNSNGSQFFITTRNSDAQLQSLNGKYTIFGEVVNGFATVDQIEKVAVDSSVYQYMPVTPVMINKISIIEK